ncbi:MAG TPA: hypothetical protein VFZ59_00365 [Verrucomicrobiae bacterium]|nr:hypothetical protein [Verrucomicrobiae bacterium]
MKAIHRVFLPGLVLTLNLITAHAGPRPSMWPPLPELVNVTYRESFDEVYYAGISNAVVTIPNYGTLRESWSGYSLERMGEVTPLVIAGLGESNRVQLTTDQGALRFWFQPYWNSGAGPGTAARLAELVATEGTQTAVLWSLRVSPDGTGLQLVGPGGSGVLLATGIDWLAGSWHQVVLNYGTNGTELVLDGEVVTKGEATLAVPASVMRLVIGSTLSGELAAGGEFEEVFCFVRPLKLAFHYVPFAGIAALGPISEAELAYRQELMEKWKAFKEKQTKASEESGGGMEMLFLGGPSADCVTNGPVYLTNVLANFTTNDGWTIYFDIAGGTNGVVYDIFSTPEFVGNDITNSVWTWLETGMTCETHYYTNQPTNQVFYVLTVPGADRDADGLYDGWEWKHFGTLAQSPSGDYDGDGYDNATEFANSTDPNSLSFSAHVGYGQAATTSPAAELEVMTGVPAFVAVLVDTNMVFAANPFSGAQWQPYTSTPTIPLPAVEGAHRVWLGLRGRAVDAAPVWFGFKVVLDQTPPPLKIIDPSGATSDKPFVQVRGYAPDRLFSVSCTVSNALGVRSNLSAFITNDDGTNRYFKCLDVPLTNGVNTIMVAVADTAGNVATTNLNVTYSPETDTNAPTVNIFWPPDGAYVATTSFTVRGALDDETASVTAQIVSSSETNVAIGMVERNGRLWVDNLPLAPGTNTLTLTATDAAGNVNTTNLTVVKSSVQITMSEIPLEQLTQPTVNVSGSIDASGYKVWINGVAATETNGTWSAIGVPVTSGGSAVFAVTAIPNSDNNGNGTPSNVSGSDPATLNPTSTNAPSTGVQPEKAPEVVRTFGHWERNLWVATQLSEGNLEAEWDRTETGGTGSMILVNENISGTYTSGMLYTRTGNNHLAQSWEGTPNNIVSTSTNFSLDTDDVTAVVGPGYWTVFEPMTSWLEGALETLGWADGIVLSNYEGAETQVVLRTGGRAGVNQQSLFVVSGSAWDRTKLGWPMIPKPDIFVPGIGKSLGADGLAYATLADGAEVLLTPETPAAYFGFTMNANKHKLRMLANGADCQTTSGNGPWFIVGQPVTFTSQWAANPPYSGEPPNIQHPLTTNQWSFGGAFVNAWSNSVPGLQYPNCSLSYYVDGSLLKNPQTTAYWVSGSAGLLGMEHAVTLEKSLTFSNGQQVAWSEVGMFRMFRPLPEFHAEVRETVRVDTNAYFSDTRQLKGGTWLHFGIASSPTNEGIAFVYTNAPRIPNTTNAYGRYFITQVVESSQQQYNVRIGASCLGYQWDGNGLDGSNPYGDTNAFSGATHHEWWDSPASGLTYASWLKRTDSFRTYLMFQPQPHANSVAVPMYQLTWGWSGTARTNGPANSWYLVSGTTPTNYQAAVTETFPTWTQNIANNITVTTNLPCFDEN